MRIVITRPRAQADAFAEVLEAAGFTPIFFPTIRIAPPDDPRPLDDALRRLNECDWAVFTSANAVAAVWHRLDRLALPFPRETRVAAVGPKTADRLEGHGIRAEFIPDEYVSDAVVPGLGDLRGKRVFLPLADLAGGGLERAVEAAGGIAVSVTAYHTRPAGPDPDGLEAIRSGVDAVAFTSGSTAANFAAMIRKAGLDPFHLPGDPLIACIGPRTAAVARETGFRVDLVAEEYTLEGMVSALKGARIR